jgi:hypothetical protein
VIGVTARSSGVAFGAGLALGLAGSGRALGLVGLGLALGLVVLESLFSDA